MGLKTAKKRESVLSDHCVGWAKTRMVSADQPANILVYYFIPRGSKETKGHAVLVCRSRDGKVKAKCVNQPHWKKFDTPWPTNSKIVAQLWQDWCYETRRGDRGTVTDSHYEFKL